MATHRELIAQNRFQLEQLGARNAHHDFEHLCRHLARLRICSNILPATGPVSAGGDQGRDAETFRTYLAKGHLADSSFVGLASNAPVAFACTIQKKNAQLKKKIKNDVKTIMESGQKVDSIHYFCASDIDTGFRHEVEHWARSELSVDLFIYDGQAIAELLADRDTFWIATEFLSVPSELYPVAPTGEEDAWYVQLLESYQQGSPELLNFATFSEIKSAVRHARYTPERRNDLPFWLAKLEPYIADGVPEMLRRRAIYEAAVASLRGMGTTDGHEERLRSYFSGVLATDEVGDLEDAATLAVYCIGAVRHHATRLSLTEILEWRDGLVAKLNRELTEAIGPGRRCDLLRIQGYLAHTGELLDVPGSGQSAVEIWLEMANLISEAPLFPLERFSSYLVEAVPVIGDDPNFETLTQQIDVLLSERVGRFAAADNCRRRAIAFFEQRKTLRAIAELHEAKVKWFADETLRGSVLAMLFVSRCYMELGLYYAAKYYAMAAAWISIRSQQPRVREKAPEALVLAGDCDYVLGNWRGFIQLTDLAMRTHWWLARDAGDFDEHPNLDRISFHVSIALSVAERCDDELGQRCRDVVSQLGLTSDIDALLEPANKMWNGLDTPAIVSRISEQLHGSPYGDLADQREATWQSCGIVWRVRWINDYGTTVVAEELIATLQIAIAEFARHDLLLLRTEGDIEVSVGDVDSIDIKDVPSNAGRRWKVVVPTAHASTFDPGEPRDLELLGVALYVLREASLLPMSEFMQVFEDAIRRGITANVFVVRPYRELFQEFLSADSPLAHVNPPELLRHSTRVTLPPVHPELAWRDGLAPNYSKSEAEAAIVRRYDRIPSKFPITMTRLSQCEEFHQTVSALRQEGWQDWHILLAVGNIVTNYRAEEVTRLNGLQDAGQAEIEHISMTVADDIDADSLYTIPLTEFNAEKLRWTLDLTMSATLKVLGLECHQLTPDIPAIQEFLAYRYNYWIDDVQHDDPFCAGATGLILLASS